MNVLPRLRLLLARRPWLRWLVVGLCAAVVATQLTSAQSALERERSRWGATRRVWLTAGTTQAGAPLAPLQEDWPEAMVPPDALAELPDNPVAARTVPARQPLTALDVAGEGTVPAGWAVFSVPGDGLPSLAGAPAVSVFSGGTRLCDGVATSGTSAAPRSETAGAEVAVPPDCAAGLSAALASGDLVIARRV